MRWTRTLASAARLVPASIAAGVLCAAVATATACGGSSGTGAPGRSDQFTVGAGGGRFAAGGLVVSVPPGAVASDVTITVSADANTPAGYDVDGSVYHFAPAGLTFAVPITVAFPAHGGSRVVQWSDAGTEDRFAPLYTTFDADGASAQVAHFSSGFVGAPTSGVTCVSQIPQPDCSVKTTTETPQFWFTTYPGAPSGDARAAIGTDSAGLAALLGNALFYDTGAHATYLSKGCCGGDFGTAHVSGDVMTSFSANASRDDYVVGCPGPPEAPMPQVKVQCSGGNVPLAPAPGAGDAGTTDAATDGPTDDGASDGGATDAGACLGAANVDPYSLLDVKTTTSFPIGSFGCSTMTTAWTKSVSAAVLTFTKPVQFVQFQNYHATFGSAAATTQLRAGCDGAAAPMATSQYDGRTTLTTLGPGTYTFIQCDGDALTGMFVAEPAPITANTNTSCATAASAPSTVNHRVYDATKLYFQYTPPTSGTRYIYLQNVSPPAMVSGSYRIEVQSTCDDAATDVVNRVGDAFAPGISGDVTAAPLVYGTTYFIVLSEIDPGMQPKLTIN